MTFGGEIVEVSGMNGDLRMTEQADGEILVGFEGGDAQNCVPSAFDLQARAGRM